MTTRRVGSKGFQPRAEGLETRQLLSMMISGQDLDGDTWTLKLTGPGEFRVVNQNDANGAKVPIGQPGLIDSIDTVGTAPLVSRLMGTVHKGPNGDGKVFFQNLTINGTRGTGSGDIFGIHVVDMPDFWLGHTSKDQPIAGSPAGSITSAQGINTLRFGGVDTTFTPPDGTPLNQNNQADTFTIALGLPKTAGTSVIVNQMITDGQVASGTVAQAPDNVRVNVLGRINLFQAKEVLGNPDLDDSNLQSPVGTIVQSNPDANTADAVGTGTDGQTQSIKILGNATNFNTQSSSRIRDIFIGGETNQVFVFAPSGVRQLFFGKGMDETTVATNEIYILQANRGALNSRVQTTNGIGQVLIGGDVENTLILSGYNHDSDTLTNLTDIPEARLGGAIGNVLVAGNVTNSIFAASVEPVLTDGKLDPQQSLKLSGGRITGKVEGTINNSVVTPTTPNQAFFAQTVHLARGPVIPPNVPEGPYPHPNAPPHFPRVAKHLKPWVNPSHVTTIAPNATPTAKAQATQARTTADSDAVDPSTIAAG